MIEENRKRYFRTKKSRLFRLGKVAFAAFKKFVALSCVAGVVIISNLPLLDAYEAHVINVTAEVHKLDDPVFDPASMGFCVMEEGVNIVSTDPDDEPVVVHYEVGAGTLDPDLVPDPDCDSPAGTGDPSTAHIDITQQDTVIKAVTCTADGLHKGRVVYEAYHFDQNLCPVVCGDCEGKVTSLTLKYNGDQPSLIKVVQKRDDAVVFEGWVEPGEQFSFVGTYKETLGTEIIIAVYVNGVENTNIHTSCSQPIGPNMVFGNFTVIAGESKEGGALCPVLDGVVLNEFLPNPDGDDGALMPDGEWVELYNNNSFGLDVAGWYLYDSGGSQPLKITSLSSDNNNNTLDAGETIVPAYGWLVVYVNGKYSDWLNNVGGDSLSLYSGGTLIDSYAYTSDALSGKAYARIPDGTGAWVDPVPTPGAQNKIDEIPDGATEDTESTEMQIEMKDELPIDQDTEIEAVTGDDPEGDLLQTDADISQFPDEVPVEETEDAESAETQIDEAQIEIKNELPIDQNAEIEPLTDDDSDIAVDETESEPAAAVSEETEEMTEEEVGNITDESAAVSDADESVIGGADEISDDLQTESDGAANNGDGGELPITPDEEAVIDFSLNL